LKRFKRPSLILFLIVLTIAAAGCAEKSGDSRPPDENGTPAAVIPTENPLQPLTICMAEAPNSLYPYGASNDAAKQVLQAVYDGPVDNLDYEYHPVILDSLPDFTGGGAQIKPVQVSLGQTVLDNYGTPLPLDHGMLVRPSGCTDGSCAVIFDGNPILMDQLVVTFKLKPGLLWANGAPLTAADSVYGFTLNQDPSAMASRYKIDRTASYIAVDDSSVVWTGLPGFMDKNYQNNFWLPAPQHAWGAHPAADLPSLPAAAQTPLGFGPYQIVESGPQQVRLEPNPNYFRKNEGLPGHSPLIFKVVGAQGTDNFDKLLNGECDLLDQAAGKNIDRQELINLENEGKLSLSWANADAWELINFGIVPRSYDDGYRQAVGDRANFFADLRVRQAIAKCIDRPQIANLLTYGQGSVMNTYVPLNHPLSNGSAASYSYDPAGGAALLDAAGWVIGESGLRQAQGIAEIDDGTAMVFNYFFLDQPQSEAVAQIVGQGLQACGIEINLFSGPPEELLAPGPEGLLFGRQFDMAQFTWQLGQEPPCRLYLSDAVPGEDAQVFPYKWGGWNLTGWQNQYFDGACRAAQAGLPGQDNFASAHFLAQQVFADELPVIPLFTYQNVIAARPDICGLQNAPISGAFWNIESLGYGEVCQ